MASSSPKPPPPDASFESLLGQVEDIIQRVESGEVGLERSIAEYERGVGLIKRCRDILTQAEQKVEELSKALSPTQALPADDRSASASKPTTPR